MSLEPLGSTWQVTSSTTKGFPCPGNAQFPSAAQMSVLNKLKSSFLELKLICGCDTQLQISQLLVQVIAQSLLNTEQNCNSLQPYTRTNREIFTNLLLPEVQTPFPYQAECCMVQMSESVCLIVRSPLLHIFHLQKIH